MQGSWMSLEASNKSGYQRIAPMGKNKPNAGTDARRWRSWATNRGEAHPLQGCEATNRNALCSRFDQASKPTS